MKRMMTLLLAAVLTAALWAGTPLPVQAANEFTPDIVYIKLDQISEEKAETRIAGVVTEVGFLDRFFRGKTIEDYSDLNELAKRVNSMTEQELHTYDGALNAESINDVSDLLRIADSLNRYIFIW